MTAQTDRPPVGKLPRVQRRGLRRGFLYSGAASSRIVLPILCIALDLAIGLLAITIATRLRNELPFLPEAGDVDSLVSQVSSPMLATWVAMLALFGAYRSHQLSSGSEEYKNVVNSSVLTAGLVGIACYIFQFPLSRAFFVLSFLIGIPLMLVGRIALRRALHSARRHGLFRYRVLVAGDATHIDELARILQREDWLGYRIVGGLRAEGQTDRQATVSGVTYVGDAAAAADAALRMRADTLVVAGGAFSSSVELRRAQWALEDQRVQVIVAPSVTDVAPERVTVRPVAGLPLVYVERPQGLYALSWAKRTFDVLGSGTLLLLLSPLMALAALSIRLHDGGPVLFRQIRVGRDGRTFAMTKFRSMVLDAEDQLDDLAPANDDVDNVMFKMAADPRITRPGQWLRRFSVDEVPQLVNVLRGEMSLVGPRPALPTEVSRYDTDVSRRLRVRPGMTGLWQVSGRSDLSWEDTVRLDLYYVDNWSMMRDVMILARTLRAVVGSDGAY